MQAPQGAVAGTPALADPRFAGPLVPRSGAPLQGGAPKADAWAGVPAGA